MVLVTFQDEPLAEALAIRRMHGAGGAVWIAARMGALALACDVAGVERFRKIAAEYQRLTDGRRQ